MELPTALHLLQLAAQRLADKLVDQWAYWLDPPPYKAQWLKEGFEKGYYYFLRYEGEVIAMYRLSDIDLEYWGPRKEVSYYVHSLVVHPNYVGQGLGTFMVEQLEEEARAKGVPLLRLDCHAGNQRLCQYYEALGFEKVGEKLMPHSLNNLYEKNLL
jgi:GNAT superfamily N-acetyltransferase